MYGEIVESVRIQIPKHIFRLVYQKRAYTGSLVPADFSGAVFTCAHFQKIAQIFSLCDFHYISEGVKECIHISEECIFGYK